MLYFLTLLNNSGHFVIDVHVGAPLAN